MAVKNKTNLKFIIVFVLLSFVIFYLTFHYLNRDSVLKINGSDKIYLALNETKHLNLDVVSKKEGIRRLKYESNNEDIVSIGRDGKMLAKEVGSTTIKVSSINGISKTIEIIVTDLLVAPTYAQEKSELSCNKYSLEEATILDEILKNDIENAGYATRAGVVAAARFLSLRFPYKINYYFENGRLDSIDREYIDGEGRYYHIGLYLSEDKYNLIEASTKTPVMWGCDLYAKYVQTYSRNGLNCSGFISWAMLNGGFDVGDIGAGITNEYDFTDMGEKVDINITLLNSGKVKVGDLIGRNSHIAIIIGLQNNKIYIAESYEPSMKVREFTIDELIESDDFKYIMLMDSIYKNDGNLTNMW